MDPLFVLPLSDKYICSIHNGVFRTPYTYTCGHTICFECATSLSECRLCFVNSPAKLNEQLQSEINTMLCYCQYGVKDGKPFRDGCTELCTYGSLREHEASCTFRTETPKKEDENEFCMIASPKSEPEHSSPAPSREVVLTACPNKEHGCFFIAESTSELETHLDYDCPFEKLQRIIRQQAVTITTLEQQIAARDESTQQMEEELLARSNEIALLRAKLFQQERSISDSASDIARGVQESSKELLEDLIKVFEEMPQTLTSAKDTLIHSEAFQKSSTAFSSLRTKIANTQITNEEFHPLDKLISTLQSLKDDLVNKVTSAMESKTEESESKAEKDDVADDDNNNNNNNNEKDSDVKEAPLNEDEDEVIKASLKSFEEEERTRRLEDAAIARATYLSLNQSQQ